MNAAPNFVRRPLWLFVPATLVAALVLPGAATQAASARAPEKLKPKFTNAAAFDVSPSLRELAKAAKHGTARPDVVGRDPNLRSAVTRGSAADGALQSDTSPSALAIPGTQANFEGLSNQDNFNVLGGRVNPPDPDR